MVFNADVVRCRLYCTCCRNLMFAFQGKLKIVELLLEYGASLNAEDKWLDTPLMYATLHGHTDIVACLIMHGCDVNMINKGIRTALHLASQNGFPEIVRLLLVSGAGRCISR